MILSRVPEWVYLSIQFFKCVRYENMYPALGMGGGGGEGGRGLHKLIVYEYYDFNL
jgi:hypothetical protein